MLLSCLNICNGHGFMTWSGFIELKMGWTWNCKLWRLWILWFLFLISRFLLFLLLWFFLQASRFGIIIGCDDYVLTFIHNFHKWWNQALTSCLIYIILLKTSSNCSHSIMLEKMAILVGHILKITLVMVQCTKFCEF